MAARRRAGTMRSMNTDLHTRLALLESLVVQQTRQQAEIAAITRSLLDAAVVDPGELMTLHQRARATALGPHPDHPVMP